MQRLCSPHCLLPAADEIHDTIKVNEPAQQKANSSAISEGLRPTEAIGDSDGINLYSPVGIFTLHFISATKALKPVC